MPIVQRPLAAVIARGDGPVRGPRDLEGHTVGVTGLPSDEAVVDSEVSADGGDPAKVDEVTIGFNAVASLAAGKVDAATGFWNAEGVELQRQGVPLRIFKVDRYGAPPYPELVLTTSRHTLDSDPGLVRSVVAATRRGYAFTERHPSRGPRRPARRRSGPRPRRTAGRAERPPPRPPPEPVLPGGPAGLGRPGPRTRPAETPARRRRCFPAEGLARAEQPVARRAAAVQERARSGSSRDIREAAHPPACAASRWLTSTWE